MNATRNFLILAVVIVTLGTMSDVRADLTFGAPVKFNSTMVTSSDDITCFSSDGLEMYVESVQAGGQGKYDLWVLKRASVDEGWGPRENLGPAINSPHNDGLACISADGLTLYFTSDRPYGDNARHDIFVTTRTTKNDPWGQAVRMGPEINGPGGVNFGAWISADNLELYVVSYRTGGYGDADIYVSKRATADAPWADAVNLGSVVNTTGGEWLCSLSPDGLLLFFSDHYEATAGRPGGQGRADLWMARRASISDAWQTPVNLGHRANSPLAEAQPRISPDGRTLCFSSTRSGSWELWQARILPVVDFNGDGIVDTKDLLRLIESWGKDDPAVDMGPMPWGDGKVDAKDVEVLMGYWQQNQETLPGNLLAYWKLDEVQGTTAADQAGGNNATLMGHPIWQPAGGRVGGVLQLDGIDDYIRTPFIVDPAQGPFSVWAWIKGGAPGQAIVSQVDGVSWLMLDSATGALKTDLQRGGRATKALCSDMVITDSDWHHVGFTWDKPNRTLYVDDAEVARDTQVSLAGSTGYMTIGTGSERTAGTFWSGLIDEVRIYNQAVKP